MRGTMPIMAVLIAGFLVGLSGTVPAQSDEQNEVVLTELREVEVVRELARRMESLRHFRIEVVDTIDEVLENGQKVQYSHLRSALVSRPDRLVLESRGDLVNRKLVKDSGTVTLIDMDHEVYVQMEFSGTI